MKQTAAVFITGIMLLFLTACGTARWVRTPVLESSRTTVNLEHREKKGEITPQQYDHPYQIPMQDMQLLLSGLLYQERATLIGGKKDIPVFQAEEVAALAPALTAGLAKATPDQRLQFTSFNKGGGLLFKNTRKTEGVLFVEPTGRINLAFNMINMDVMEADSEDLPQLYVNSDPMMLKYADTVLVPPAYSVVKNLENGKPAPMWIVVDAAKLKEAAAAVPQPAPVAAVPAQAPVYVSPPAAAPAPVAPASAATVKPAITEPPAASTDHVQEDIKGKLKYLKGLYDDGLISESEYAAEKKKLLDKIE